MQLPLIAASVALVCGQDLFLEKQGVDAEASASRRRRRRSSAGNKHTCVKQCLATDEDENFHKCNHDGSGSCATSKCCELEGYTCYTKNAYWSACATTCKTGIPDAMGETWDCTALSPSKCETLRPCVEGCWGSDLESDNSSALGGAGDFDCSGYASKTECEETHCKSRDPALNKMWKAICDENCPDAPAKKCPKSSFSACIKSCPAASLAPEHGSSCEKDGSTSCVDSKCCRNPSDKCFTKTPYWASCAPSCEPGKPNPLDGQIWDCEELAPKQTCDPYLYRSCVSTCWSQC